MTPADDPGGEHSDTSEKRTDYVEYRPTPTQNIHMEEKSVLGQKTSDAITDKYHTNNGVYSAS